MRQAITTAIRLMTFAAGAAALAGIVAVTLATAITVGGLAALPVAALGALLGAVVIVGVTFVFDAIENVEALDVEAAADVAIGSAGGAVMFAICATTIKTAAAVGGLAALPVVALGALLAAGVIVGVAAAVNATEALA